jgi:hypothetical protein
LPPVRPAVGPTEYPGKGWRGEPEAVGPRWVAERGLSARALRARSHGASPPPFPRSAPHPLFCSSPPLRAAPGQEMRRGGSRREPALSPRSASHRPPPWPPLSRTTSRSSGQNRCSEHPPLVCMSLVAWITNNCCTLVDGRTVM